jgi:hypothetical protein
MLLVALAAVMAAARVVLVLPLSLLAAVAMV